MVVVITEGERDENRRLFAPHRIERVLLQSEREIADAYQAFGTPAAVVVEPDGSIGSSLAMGADAIRALIATLGPGQSNGWASHAVAVGQAAPDFTARDERGETVALAQFRGRDVIILFWNPQCGFCRQAAGELLPLSAETTAEIVVASTGRDEELIGGLRGTMIRDDESKIAHMFGASGTPMAVRVDADGRVASPVAAGKDAVIEIFLGG
jgi:thioredoxin-related protein